VEAIETKKTVAYYGAVLIKVVKSLLVKEAITHDPTCVGVL
jgi:hypothetical protein